MAKYSYEFKKRIVQEYLDGEGGYRRLETKYQINRSMIRKWVTNYKEYGEGSLMRGRKRKEYTFEFKLHVVELYLRSELSYRELALQVGMTEPATIVRWVNEYRASGAEGLMPREKGRKRMIDKDKIIREIEKDGSEEQKELLKQLQDENLRLRIENAFLKEARRLRLEEERLLNEKRESSTASGENSN
jgi:transposase